MWGVADRLKAVFGADNVFRDVGSINPGTDFRGAILEAIYQSDFVLVLIGPQWLDLMKTRQEKGSRDWVQQEIEAGLQSNHAKVVPLLLDGASMPSARDLPSGILELAHRQALQFQTDESHFEGDSQRLIATLRSLDSDKPPLPRRLRWLILSVVIVLIAILGLTEITSLIANTPASPDATEIIRMPMASFTTGVNVRLGPGPDYPPIGALGSNDTAELLAVNTEGTWYKLRYKGSEGWVQGDLVLVTGDKNSLPVKSGPPLPTIGSTDTSIPTVTPTEMVQGYPCEGTVIFRSGGLLQVKISPLRNAPNQTTIQQGTTVQLLERRSSDGEDWYKISFENVSGWITTDLIDPSSQCSA